MGDILKNGCLIQEIMKHFRLNTDEIDNPRTLQEREEWLENRYFPQNVKDERVTQASENSSTCFVPEFYRNLPITILP